MRYSRLRRMLDKLFARKKLALILPLVTAALFAVLAFFLNGETGENEEYFKLIPIVVAVTFLIVYAFLRLLLSITYCPGWYIDTCILIILSGTGISAIVQIISFFIDFSSFSSSLCVCVTCWSAVSAAHSKRNIYKD